LISLLEKFIDSGINKIRFTGGEPLVRKDIGKFFNLIEENPKFEKITLGITTNGIFLDKYLKQLEEANIKNINISLDSLRKENFKNITGLDSLEKVLENIQLLKSKNFAKIKINVVSARNVNDSEILDFVQFAIENELTLRFIEYMPFSDNGWNDAEFLSATEIINNVRKEFDLEMMEQDNKLATEYRIKGTNTLIGTISPISEHFCGSCNRLRMTSDGQLKLCLFSDARSSFDLKDIFNLSNEEFAKEVQGFLSNKQFSHPEVEDLIKLNDFKMLSIGG
jgi:cyclic pyranopterin phosphate synthase